MLKKITNWTFGSIFRTFGRIIAYIIIGILVSLLFIKRDYVKADTYLNPVNVNWKDGAGNTLQNFGYEEFYYQSASTKRQLDNYNAMIFQGQIDVTNSHGSYIEIPLDIRYSESIYDNDYSNNNVVCEHWTPTGTNNYYCDSWTNQEQTGVYETNSRPFLSIYAISVFTNGYVDVCNIDLSNNVVRCPVASTVNYNTIQDIRVFSNVYYGTSNILQTTYQIAFGKRVKLYKGDNTQEAVENQTQQQQSQHNETMSYFNSTISGEVNGTGENGTITDEDAESGSCGIICKLKHLIKMLSIDNIKYIVVPTEEQMNDLFEQMQEKVTSKLGILGLPVTVYTRLMQIAMQYDDSQSNWCLQWDNVPVPNFEEYNIIQGGQWCFSDILANQKINTFRSICISIIGGLILLSFIQYLYNCLHRVLDVPVRDDYTYFTTEDVYNIDTDTGEVTGHQIRSRQTRRER